MSCMSDNAAYRHPSKKSFEPQFIGVANADDGRLCDK